MSKVLGLFSRTLEQFAEASDRSVGEQERRWGARARLLGAGLALTLAASASAQQVVMSQSQQDAQDRAQMGARAGGVLGAVAGIALTRDSSTLVRVLGAALGAWGGSAVGRAVAGPDHESVSVNQPTVASDALFGVLNGRPGDQIATSLRGRYNEPVIVTRQALDDAVRTSSSGAPEAAQGMRPLEAEVHQGLYRMMVDMVAYRAAAVAALRESERLQLVAAVDAGKRREAEGAAQLSREAFNAYNGAFRKVWDVIAMADQGGYDVFHQRLALSAVPVDLRTPVQANLRWPGVEQRSLEVAQGLVAVRVSQLAELDGRAAQHSQHLRLAVARPSGR